MNNYINIIKNFDHNDITLFNELIININLNNDIHMKILSLYVEYYDIGYELINKIKLCKITKNLIDILISNIYKYDITIEYILNIINLNNMYRVGIYNKLISKIESKDYILIVNHIIDNNIELLIDFNLIKIDDESYYSIVKLLNYYNDNNYIVEDIYNKIKEYRYFEMDYKKISYINIELDDKKFIRYLEKNKYDIIVDVGNVGYNDYGKTFKFNVNNIIEVLNKYNGSILLISSLKHKKDLKTIPFKINVYYTPYNINDDIYWLYAALYYKTYYITNDKIRDHIKLSNNRGLDKFKYYYQLKNE